jgi:FKBP-type peptidyl-prolyl cis-trans isomerase
MYGTDGAAGHPGFKIPPKADLVFEIEVLNIR